MKQPILYGDVVGLNKQLDFDLTNNGREINLDCAATTPAFTDVANAVNEHLRTYGSIGRGKGPKSLSSSLFYEEARNKIKSFVGIHSTSKKYEVIFTNNTTDGINKLASALITSEDDVVLTTPMEHHANLLPWRMRCKVYYVDLDENGRVTLDNVMKKLEEIRNLGLQCKLVAVSAASNVTGYVNDVHAIANLAHEFGAQIVVDGAQIVAHRAFSMFGEMNCGIDYFVFSAHKMYSPFGGGVLIGLKEELDKHLPMFYGGGMVEEVTMKKITWLEGEARYEAGSPNFLGVVGMVKAIEILENVGFDAIQKHEQELLEHAIEVFENINKYHPHSIKTDPQITMYGDTKNISDKVGILTFNLTNIMNSDEMVAERLSADGIAVRHGKFCAHIYVDKLMGKEEPEEGQLGCPQGGMVRISFGIFTTKEDITALADAICDILEVGDDKLNAKVSELKNASSKLPPDRG